MVVFGIFVNLSKFEQVLARAEVLCVKNDYKLHSLIPCATTQRPYLILPLDHDYHWFPPRVKTSAFRISNHFSHGGGVIFVALSNRCAKMECLVLKRITNLFDLI